MTIKAVCKILVVLMLCASVQASDSLRTVSEFGRRVFRNLNMADTLNGVDGLDSNIVQAFVREAVPMVSYQAKTSITTTSGTMWYNISGNTDSVRAAFVKKGGFAYPLRLRPIEEFLEAYQSDPNVYDTTGLDLCAVFGDTLYLYPVPARTDTVIVLYWTHGGFVSASTDTVTTAPAYYPWIEFYATVRSAAVKEHQLLPLYEGFFSRESSRIGLRGKTE